MLHGDVSINYSPVADWHAVRLEPLEDPVSDDTWCRYRCRVTVVTTEGTVSRAFEVMHRYGDGAAVLAAKVLLEHARIVREAQPIIEEHEYGATG